MVNPAEWARKRRKIFVVAHGQQENIGDSVLRRAMLSTLRGQGDLFIHVGSNDDDFLSGLGVDASDEIIQSSSRWLLRGLVANIRGELLAVGLNAGEAQLSARYTYHTAPAYLLAIAARLTRRPVLMTGVGLKRGGHRFWMVPLRLATGGRGSVVTWRDADSRARAGFGGVQPDWALTEGPPIAHHDNEPRDVIAISMRGDHSTPGPTWFDVVREVASTAGLQVVAVSQVERDNERSAKLASELSGVSVVSFDDSDHATHEARVRAIYRRSRLVISDRLHSLMIGVTEGAVPVAFATHFPEKAARTLASAGFSQTVAKGEGDELVTRDVVGSILTQSQRRLEYMAELEAARARIDTVRARIEAALRGEGEMERALEDLGADAP